MIVDAATTKFFFAPLAAELGVEAVAFIRDEDTIV